MATPYNDNRSKTEQVRDMFDNIAPAYDRMNLAMSFGLDSSWRSKAVDLIAERGAKNIVDIATGTGDFAISLAKRIPESSVTGVDLSEGMVEIGRKKIADAGLTERITLITGDCLKDPLPAGSADAVTVAFGVRNFSDILAGYKAMFRMLRPGGTLCVLELSLPVNPIVKPFYKFYTHCIIPAIGRMVSKDRRAYSYLPESIAAIPHGSQMAELMKEAGFIDTKFQRLTLGVCTLYTAVTPS